MGRPPAKPRSSLGERIAIARLALGLTQKELAQKIGVTQRVVTYWERESVSIRPEQLNALADALGVSADDLMGRATTKKTRQSGPAPVGKIRRVFEDVSRLPRYQQLKIVEVVEALVARQTKAA